MQMPNCKQLLKELQLLQSVEIRENLPFLKGVFIKNNDDDFTKLVIYLKIEGPTRSLYEGCVYYVKIHGFTCYPQYKPIIKFLNICLHPNVSRLSNTMCKRSELNLTIIDLIFGIFHLLEEPDFAHGYYYAQPGDTTPDKIKRSAKQFVKPNKYPESLPIFVQNQ